MTNAPEEGDTAPAIDLPTDGGGRFKLKDARGSVTVVYFYPKDDTSGCTKEAIEFSARKADFEAAGASIVGISPDAPAKHEKFREKHALTVTLAADEDTSVAQAYGVWIEKSMYGRKYMGIDRSTFLVDKKGKLARVWRKVKVPGHVDEVLAAVKALG